VVDFRFTALYAETAERIIAANHLQQRIRVFHKSSRELEIGHDLEQRADILVSELISSDLLAEGVLDPGAETSEDSISESVLRAEVTREPDEERREQLGASVERVLDEVRAAVEDWGPMRDRLGEIVQDLDSRPGAIDRDEVKEAKEFLKWLADDRFTFLGYREYDLVSEDGKAGPRVRKDTGLGILRGTPQRQFTPLSEKALKLARAPHPLVGRCRGN